MDEAIAASARYIEAWSVSRANPSAPLYSGGVYDSWPGDVVDALAVLNDEYGAIIEYRAHLRAQEAGHG